MDRVLVWTCLEEERVLEELKGVHKISMHGRWEIYPPKLLYKTSLSLSLSPPRLEEHLLGQILGESLAGKEGYQWNMKLINELRNPFLHCSRVSHVRDTGDRPWLIHDEKSRGRELREETRLLSLTPHLHYYSTKPSPREGCGYSK